MKFKTLLTISLTITSFAILNSKIFAADNTTVYQGKCISHLSNESLSIKELNVTFELVAKSNDELDSILLSKRTQINVTEKYSISSVDTNFESTKFGFQVQDSSGNNLVIENNNYYISVNGKKLDIKVEKLSDKENTLWYTFEIPKSSFFNNSVEIQVSYSIQAGTETGNPFEVIKYNISNSTGWSGKIITSNITFKFPYNITSDTFPTGENINNLETNPTVYDLNQSNKTLSWTKSNLDYSTENDIKINFLPQRINNVYLSSISLINADPTSIDGKIKRGVSLAEMLNLANLEENTKEDSPLYKEASDIFSNLYESNQSNNQIVINYAYALAISLGIDSDASLLDNLTFEALESNPNNVHALESRYLYFTGQWGGKRNNLYLPISQEEDVDFLYLSPKWDMETNTLIDPTWGNAEDFEYNRIEAQQKYNDYLSYSTSLIEMLTKLNKAKPNNLEYIYLLINSHYLEDFLVGNITFIFEKKDNNAYLSIEKYKDSPFNEIKPLITNYLEIASKYDTQLPQILLNYSYPESYNNLVNYNTEYETDTEVEEEGTTSTTTVWKASQYYLNWVANDALKVIILFITFIILFILFLKNRVNQLLIKIFTTIPNSFSRRPPKTKARSALVAASEGYSDETGNPLEVPKGMMD